MSFILSNTTLNEPPPWLLERTFVIEYSPVCHKQWMVRLIGHKRATIDKLPHNRSYDAIGYGDTLVEASTKAKQALARQAKRKENEHIETQGTDS